MGKNIGQKVQLPRPMVDQLPRSNESMFEDDQASLWWKFSEWVDSGRKNTSGKQKTDQNEAYGS